MSRSLARRRLVSAVVATAAAATAVVAVATPSGARPSADDAGLAAVRAHVRQYADISRALADGYVPAGPCEEGMGHHYLLPGRFDGTLEIPRPEVLLYRFDEAGRAHLLGAEYMVVDADGSLDTSEDRPEAYGHAFDGPMTGHAPGMPVHYDLHAWAFEPNPLGAFTAHNPRVSCP